ncbi:hypothetical protein, partial [Nocardioides jensenii]|uniref:hypothetical protein n=1 Tax=Nocardioides jensenii TaxID=1843 RepID=UPI001C3F3D34
MARAATTSLLAAGFIALGAATAHGDESRTPEGPPAQTTSVEDLTAFTGHQPEGTVEKPEKGNCICQALPDVAPLIDAGTQAVQVGTDEVVKTGEATREVISSLSSTERGDNGDSDSSDSGGDDNGHDSGGDD